MKKSVGCLAAVSLLVAAFLWSAVASADTITVSKPSGGSLLKNHSSSIEWTYAGTWAGKGVKITLFKAGVKVGDIVSNSSPFVMNAGGRGSFSYPWNVGTFLGGTADAGSGYTIRIKVVNETTTGDSAQFGIASLGMVTPEMKEESVSVQTAKSNLRVSFTLSPANCATQAGTVCNPSTWIFFPITVSNVGMGAARTKHEGEPIMWRVYLVWLGQNGLMEKEDNDWNMQWWGSVSPSQLPAGKNVTIDHASGSSNTGPFSVTRLLNRDFGTGKWRLSAVIDSPDTVEETNEGDNTATVEFWVQ